MAEVMESQLPARTIVEKSLLERKTVDESGEIVCFPNSGLPWRGHLYELEKKHTVDPLVKFVLYTDQGGMWRIQAVTVEGKAFENRLSLPEACPGEVYVTKICPRLRVFLGVRFAMRLA